MNILASPIAPHVDAPKILHGCCIALMRAIADDSVDMILTDPPYYSTALDFDQSPRIDFKVWLMECQRILKPSAYKTIGKEVFRCVFEVRNSPKNRSVVLVTMAISNKGR